MKKQSIISLLLIGFAAFFIIACHPKKEGTETTEKTEQETPVEPIEKEKTVEITQLPELTVGQWYRTKTDNRRTAFIIVDAKSEESAQGRYYTTEDGPWAMPHAFNAQIGRRYVRTSVDGGTPDKKTRKSIVSQYNFMPYEQPPFTAIRDLRYRKPLYGVSVTNDIVYGHADGYWTSIMGYEEKSYAKVIAEGISNSLNKHDLELTLDLYRPEGAKTEKHPLILFIHGGAFYVGDKQNAGMMNWCRHFASMGYVCASMNYRLGFLPTRYDIERAGYMAIQDANAAMRFLVTHANEYGINTDEIYTAGTSAGSITALNLAFMDEDSRPDGSRGKDGLFKRERNEDLGKINESGNDLKADFHIRAIANMWGAVNNLDILKNSHTDIVSFHGDQDQLVPYDHGTPFNDVAEKVGQRLFSEMYGSASIDRKAKELGLKSKFYSFPGEGHAFNVDKEGNINANHYIIRDSIASFFYREMVPVDAAIAIDTHHKGGYTLDCADADSAQWKVDGGFVVRTGKDFVRILWRADEPKHSIQATGAYHNGIGFLTRLKCEPPMSKSEEVVSKDDSEEASKTEEAPKAKDEEVVPKAEAGEAAAKPETIEVTQESEADREVKE